MTTDDRKRDLIEQATWDLIEWDADTSDRGVSDEHYRERRADVERVWAVFEAAQKPTDDERLMQAPAIRAVRDVLDYYADEIDLHIWQEIASVVDDIPDCESATAMPHDEHAEPQSEPTIADGFLATAQALGLSPEERRAGMDRLAEAGERVDRSQGEPSDAAIEAALQALGHARSGVTPQTMRAALRAAAEEGKTDDHR